MPSISKVIAVVASLSFGILHPQARAKTDGVPHPMESLGDRLFNSFKANDFNTFFQSSIFSLNESTFRSFLKDIRNKTLREDLIAQHKIRFPPAVSTLEQKWQVAFQHNWREQWRHLVRNSRNDILNQAFLPILNGAKEYDIQWKTTKLIATEILLPVTWTNVGFEIKGDQDLDSGPGTPRTLFLDRDCTYRLRPDKLTYAKAFMVGLDKQDSGQAYDKGILGNGTGEGDILIRFGANTPDKLYYFCPDQNGAGGNILIKDFNDPDKPNQRIDLLLTFSYGQPTRYYQILVREIILTASGPLFCERPEWIGVVNRPLGISAKNTQ
jgi:hypothetical protein